MWLNIRQKILVTFGIIVLMVMALGLYQLDALRSAHILDKQIDDSEINLLNEVHSLILTQQRAQADAERLRDLIFLAALGNQTEDKGLVADRWRASRAKFAQAIDALGASMQNSLDTHSSAGLDLHVRQLAYELAAAEKLFQQVGPLVEREIEDLEAGRFGAADEQRQIAATTRQGLEDKLAQIQNIVMQFVGEGDELIQEARDQATVVLIAAVLGIIAVGALATWVLQRSIIEPLQRFARFVEQVGAGNLASTVTLTGRDEISKLGEYLNNMVVGLRELAAQTSSVATSLNTATIEIRASTQQQAASVEEQLAAVQETSATLDEITQSGAQVSRRAQDLSTGSEATLQASGIGLQAVEDTARVMDAIREQAESVAENIVMLSEKTQAVGDIIATVNDISERSHILALNAAIEAAAAGEHGRSFAVVAAEIKNLADQSKEATVQVRAVLGDIQRGINTSVMLTEEAVKRVASGKSQTDTAQSSINDLTDSIQESTDTFQQIVAAINQQHIGLEQVMVALRNIRQASTQTAEGTRQLDGAAANMGVLSAQLAHAVGRYRL